MKPCFSLTILVLIISFSSCNKDSSSSHPSDTSVDALVKTIQVFDSMSLQAVKFNTLYYDSQKRLTRIVESGNSDPSDTTVFYHDFYYYTNKVILLKTKSTSSAYDKVTFILNSKGLAESCAYYRFLTPADSIFEYSTSFEYDADGFLLKQTDYSSPDYTINAVTTFIYSKNNLISMTLHSLFTHTMNYTHDEEHLNTLGNKNCGVGFFGRSDSYLLMNIKDDSTNSPVAGFDYQLDPNYRISQMHIRGYSRSIAYNWIIVPYNSPNQVLTYTYY
jgi:hypothetical protein